MERKKNWKRTLKTKIKWVYLITNWIFIYTFSHYRFCSNQISHQMFCFPHNVYAFSFFLFLVFRIVANDIFKQDWRSQTRGGILQYIVLKWTLACLVGLLTGITGFSINLAVENIAGFKLLKVDQFIQDNRWCLLSFIFIHQVFKHVTNGKYISKLRVICKKQCTSWSIMHLSIFELLNLYHMAMCISICQVFERDSNVKSTSKQEPSNGSVVNLYLLSHPHTRRQSRTEGYINGV